MKYHVGIGGDEQLVDVQGDRVAVGGHAEPIEIVRTSEPDRMIVRFHGRSASVFARRADAGWEVSADGHQLLVTVEDERTHRIRQLATAARPVAASAAIRAPMPGLIVNILASQGQTVEAGDPLIVMEAMKMENELRAPSRGLVSMVAVEVGETVRRDDVLVEIEREVTSDE